MNCEAKRYSCIMVCGDDHDDDDGEMESVILELLFAQDRIHFGEYASTSIIYFYLYQFPFFIPLLCSFGLLCYRIVVIARTDLTLLQLEIM